MTPIPGHSSMSFAASRKVDLGDPISLRRFSLFSMPELNDLSRQLTDCDFLPYAYLSGFRNAAAFLMIALLPLSEDSSVRLLRNMFQRNRLAVAGFDGSCGWPYPTPGGIIG